MTARVTLLCGSRKPAPGRTGRSAARELLRVVDTALQNQGIETEFLDLRELELPMFDGRSVDEYGNEALTRVRDALQGSNLTLFSVPAYWNGPSGPFKNLLDLLGGAAYDAVKPTTPLTGKLVALLVVGADDASAHNAAAQVRVMLNGMGAWVLPEQVVVGNLRQVKDPNAMLVGLQQFGERLPNAVLPLPAGR